MPDTPVSLLAAYLWDLRAQCERQVRCLTSAQRILDELWQAGDAPSDGRRSNEVRKYLGEVAHAHATIGQSIADAFAELSTLERLINEET